MKPLEGIKVLDFTHAYSAVFAAMQLADLGADLIKIEQIGGEQSRTWMPFAKDHDNRSAYYATFNRNRTNLAINTKKPEGKQVIYDLVKNADIVMVNMRNGAMDSLGLGYEDLKKINPSLIYVTLNGYGSRGPLSGFKAYDNICSAYSGVMYATGRPDQPPMKLGISIGDNYVGLNMFSSTLAALYHRKKTGEGQLVEVAMMDSLFGLLDKQILEYSMTGVEPERTGNAHTEFAPEDVFTTAGEDNHVALSVRDEAAWRAFCTVMGHEEWAEDPRFSSNALRKKNYEELYPLIAEAFAVEERDAIAQKLCEAGVACAPSMRASEIMRAPQYVERHMIRYQNDIQVGVLYTAGLPMKFSDTVADEIRTSRFPGQDNETILRERLGYSEETIRDLQEKQVIHYGFI